MYKLFSLLVVNTFLARAACIDETDRGCDFFQGMCRSDRNCHSNERHCKNLIYKSRICCCDLYCILPRSDCRPYLNYPCEIRTICVKPVCKLSLECFIEKTLCVIKRNEKFCDENRIFVIRRILCIIYNNLKCDIKELALFTATALHNTSYFKCWENKTEQCEKYHSRGLLMIRELCNYEILDRVAKHNHDYVSCPSKLALSSEFVIIDTICFWKELFRGKCMSFDIMMEILNPWEYRQYVEHGKKLVSWINRENLYCQLYNAYKK